MTSDALWTADDQCHRRPEWFDFSLLLSEAAERLRHSSDGTPFGTNDPLGISSIILSRVATTARSPRAL
jgi:hypothetical protein